MRAPTLPALVLCLGLTVPAISGESRLQLDPASTRVAFSLDATLHTAEGTIPLSAGEVRFDRATGAAAGRLVFDATRATTANEGRDRKMHAEVLESGRFPEIVFTPRRADIAVDEAGRGAVTLVGTLAIHGVDHELTVKAQVARNGDRVRAEGSFVVPYVAWGMKDPSVFLLRVAKEVRVSFTTDGALADVATGDALR
jgi:polyisoprenoid-binding protein YceI